MNQEIQPLLEQAGLTKQEAKTYLALLQLQEAQTGPLCQHTGIASSNIYNILDALTKKGLVTHRIQNNTKVFMPSHPDALTHLFETKQQQLEKEKHALTEAIKQLKTHKPENPPQSNYKYYEGMQGIKSLWHEVNAALTKTSEERIHGAKKEGYERLVGFYDEHHKIRNKLKAKAKILIPPEDKPLGEKRKNKNTQVKYKKLSNLAEWGVVDDMVYLQHIITKEPRGFLIKDKIFAQTLAEAFDNIWQTAKP